jgi:PAS domain S-box-containing protein
MASYIDDPEPLLPAADLRLLRQLFEHTPVLVAMLRGPNHVFAYANPAYRRLVGGRDLVGRTVDEALPELAEQGFADLLDRVYRTGEPFVGEGLPSDIHGPGGGSPERRYFDFIYQPVLDASGRVTGIFGQATDVTGRVTTEQALRRSQALGAAILEASLDCIVTIDETSAVMEWNAAAEATFGYRRDEVIGRDLTELIIPAEQREAHRRGMERFLRTGRGPVIGRRIEVEALTRRGERIPVELAISPILLEGQTRFTSSIRDIRGRLAAEAALRESEQRLRATYEHAFAGIGEVDREGRFTRVNEQFCKISGYPRAALVGRTIWDITHEEDAAAERPMFEAQMAGRLPVYSLEKRYVHPDGRVVWVELAASTVDDEAGRPLYGVRVVRDVSERKAWESGQQLLINELNHRVKNTLATVQSIAAQARRGRSDPEAGYEAFLDRLSALARAHDELTRQRWEGAWLGSVVEGAVEPFGGADAERFKISGPAVRLQPKAALAIATALHELATNAAKHGSLSRAGGCVELEWALVAPEALRMTWREVGGPPVAAPERKGFGSRLLEKGLPAELGGRVSLDFRPDGLVCTIEAPLNLGC